jgi:hypothetical protein
MSRDSRTDDAVPTVRDVSSLGRALGVESGREVADENQRHAEDDGDGHDAVHREAGTVRGEWDEKEEPRRLAHVDHFAEDEAEDARDADNESIEGQHEPAAVSPLRLGHVGW